MPSRWAWPVPFVLFAAALAGAAAVQKFEPRPFDWPQWRGPDRSGDSKETGLLQTWPPQGPPLVWKAHDLGTGFSGPAVSAGRIFGLSARGPDEVAWALDEGTGRELWRQRFAQAKPTRNSQYRSEGPRSTPTVDGPLVYVLGVSGDLACLEADSGKVRWQKNLPADFGGVTPGWGYSESPLVDGDKVVCTPGGKNATLVALDKHTGEVVWKAPVPGGDGAAYSSIVVAEVDGLRVYVQMVAGGLVGVAAEDGRFLFRYDRMANRVANIATPIVKGNLVFASTSYNGGSALIRLTRGGGGVKAEEVYYLPGKVLQNHHGGMVLVGDYVYGGHGQNKGAPVCIEFATGKERWRRERGPGEGSAAVTYADGQLYFRYQDGTMSLIKATPEEYKLDGRFKLPDNSGKPSWPHPVIANGKMYIRDMDELLCYDVNQP